MRRMWAFVLAVAHGLACAATCAAGQLPQAQPYQIALRNYMATLREQDFETTLQPMTYDASYLPTVEDVYRHWMWHDANAPAITPHKGLRVDPYYLTLASIEANGRVNLRAGRGALFDPMDVAWWAQWDYPGNPYRPGTANSTAARRRAFVCAAVDMMMLDELFTPPGAARSDYLGGAMIWQSYAFLVAKDVVPPEARAAYEAGLRRAFARLESCFPYGSGGSDMEMFQLVSAWYAAEALDDDAMRARALARAHYVIDNIIKPAGYEQHGQAFDSSYMGIALHFMTWAAMLYDDPKITATLEGLLMLKSHLTFPEPGGTSGFTTLYVGPNHFNTGTSMSAPNDQWSTAYRDACEGMMSDAGQYLTFSGRTWGAGRLPLGIKNEASMRSNIVSWLGNNNTGTDGLTKPNTSVPGAWAETHWTWGLNYLREYYRPGYYPKARRLMARNEQITKPPFSRKADFIQTFVDDMLMFKVGEYGGMIHTDTVCDKWADHVSGLSGGCLSAFWTPTSGTVLLGQNGGGQLPTYEKWSEWETWACHAISGANADGLPFSSSRNQNPVAQYAVSGATAATVHVTGAIGLHDGGMSAPSNAIVGQVAYERWFDISASGLRVRTTLTSDQSDSVRQLWEILPVHLRHGSQAQDAEVDLEVGGSWIPATTNLQPGVTRARITRFGTSVYIVFDAAQAIKLSWAINARAASMVRNLMVDLLGSGGAATSMPASVEVAYRIMMPPASLRITGQPDDHGRPVPLGYGRYITNVAFGAWITNRVGGVVDTIEGARRACVGWSLEDGTGVPQGGITTQAVFQLATNSVLTWLWTNEFQLAATAEPNGILSAPIGWHRDGAAVQLSATGTNGHTFVDWTGDVPPDLRTNNPLALVMDQPRTVKARFGFRLQVAGVPAPHGVSAPFGYGVWTNLAEGGWVTNGVGSPAEQTNGVRYACAGWALADGGGAILTNGPGAQAVFRVDGDRELRWSWGTEYQLAVSAASGGTASAASGWYGAGTVVTAAASAAGGFAFLQWTGPGVPEGGGTNNPLALPMDQPRTVQAVFSTTSAASRVWRGTGLWTSPTNWAPAGVPGAADVLAVTTGICLVPDPLRCAALTVGSGGTLVMSNWASRVSAQTIMVQSNGTVTLPPAFGAAAMSNRIHLVCADLTVAPGGAIDADGRGYAGGISLTMTNGAGLGRGKNGDGGGGGAGYGGAGGDGTNAATFGSPYGLPAQPEAPGSGGGGCRLLAGTGGAGGGAVRIEASGRVHVSGRVSASGAGGSGRGGGGSGGGIYVDCLVFSGRGGVVRADGGAAGTNAGGAGGGRIAVRYDAAAQAAEPKPDVRFSALPTGGAFGAGRPGTVYFPDTAMLTLTGLSLWAELVLPGNALEGERLVFRDGLIRLGQTGFRLAATSAIEVDGSNVVVELGPHGVLEAPSLVVTNGGRLTVCAGPTNAANPAWGALVSVSGTVSIASNSWVHPYSDAANGGSVLFRVIDLRIGAGGGIDGTGKGYGGLPGGNGLGYGNGFSAAANGSGAGYGGSGGRSLGQASVGAPYGSEMAPADPGSGGGARSGLATSTGGRGGGAVRVEAAGSVSVDGTIAADGGVGMHGGGSGGSIWIRCASFGGSTGAVISARGGGPGTMWPTNNGCGGGGRIAVWRPAGADDYSGAYDVSGGSGGYQNGATGTVVVMQPCVVTVEGIPARHGAAWPLDYGTGIVAAAVAWTNAVASPTAPADGMRYACTGWVAQAAGGGVAGSGSGTQSVFAVTSDTALTWIWRTERLLTARAGDGGGLSPDPSGWYGDGERVAITALAVDPYRFAGWMGDVPAGQTNANPLVLTMDQARTVTARFELGRRSLLIRLAAAQAAVPSAAPGAW